MSDQDVAKVRLAYARLFNDNPQPGDGKTVLADLALRSGFYDVPSIAAWMKQKKSTEGYEINCHELSGKRALFKAIKDFASLTESEMLWLEQVARLAPAED
ncbi:hypothetical protein [Tardiphaga sp.]|uniref:hypothetical protein n=1 Tax=Tardiphaga sp. TaxID=1926292 RepID=UPI0037D9FE03